MDFDFEGQEWVLKVIELISWVLLAYFLVFPFAFFVLFLELFVFLALHYVLELVSYSPPELSNDKLGGKFLDTFDHVQFLHQLVAVALITAHLELFEQSKCHKCIQAHSRQQNQQYDYSWKIIGNSVISVSYCGHSDDDDFEAVNKSHVWTGQKEAVWVK